MFFITNRKLNEGLTPDSATLPRSISFDLQNNESGQSVYFCQRTGANVYQEIGSRAFFSALKEVNYDQILLYLHGYDNLPEPATFPRAEELQRLCDRNSTAPQSNAVRTTKVLVVPLIWPCDNDFGQVVDYYDDQIAADHSGVAFARLFQKFLEWRTDNSNLENPCTKRVNVLAHSMGGRVLRAAMTATVRYFLPHGMPLIFRNIFLAATDISNNCLEAGQEGSEIAAAARNVVVYFATDDMAMRASKVANVGTITSRRMGHTGPANLKLVPKNVFALDCDDFNTLYDYPVGHGYFASAPDGKPGQLFTHLWQAIVTGRVSGVNETSREGVL